MGSLHNTLAKIADPFNLTTKVTGSNDPFDFFGGATKAREETNAAAVVKATDAANLATVEEYESTYGKTKESEKFRLETIGVI